MEMFLGITIVLVLLNAFMIIGYSINNSAVTEVLHAIHEDNRFDPVVIKIKSDILRVYSDKHCTHKRELIVQKLIKLNMHEDTSDFLEKHNYIHDYIFNHYLYD